MKNKKTALLIVDLQNDFLPGGSLPVHEGDQIISVVNQLLELPFDLKIATQDWHPANHGSFAGQHQKKPGEVVLLGDIQQILWPDHCIQGSIGAALVSTLNQNKIDRIFHKGTDVYLDSYSAFFDNEHRRSTGLAEYLKQQHIEIIYIVGLATDYCVKYSALDALALKFHTYIIKDACRGVNLQPQDSENAFYEMQRSGAELITSQEILC